MPIPESPKGYEFIGFDGYTGKMPEQDVTYVARFEHGTVVDEACHAERVEVAKLKHSLSFTCCGSFGNHEGHELLRMDTNT